MTAILLDCTGLEDKAHPTLPCKPYIPHTHPYTPYPDPNSLHIFFQHSLYFYISVLLLEGLSHFFYLMNSHAALQTLFK